jgi:hypothetical protein
VEASYVINNETSGQVTLNLLQIHTDKYTFSKYIITGAYIFYITCVLKESGWRRCNPITEDYVLLALIPAFKKDTCDLVMNCPLLGSTNLAVTGVKNLSIRYGPLKRGMSFAASPRPALLMG